MSDYPERLEALKHALTFTAGREATAEDLIFTSTVIENYLAAGSRKSDGSTVRVVFGLGMDGALRDGGDPIDKVDDVIEQSNDVSTVSMPVSLDAPVDDFAVTGSDGLGNLPNQPLAGQVLTHSSSSSVLADGDSGDSVAADPRNNGTPDTFEKGVNGDA